MLCRSSQCAPRDRARSFGLGVRLMRAAFVVFCGVALWTLLWLGGNTALASLIPHVYRDDGTTGHAGVLGVILLLSGLCSLAAGYVVSALARGRWRGPRDRAGRCAAGDRRLGTIPILATAARVVPRHLSGRLAAGQSAGRAPTRRTNTVRIDAGTFSFSHLLTLSLYHFLTLSLSHFLTFALSHLLTLPPAWP
jgi:hypothetical protein